MVGQSIGGVTPVIINIIITSANVAQKDIGFWCFLFATGFLVFTLALIVVCQRTEYFKHYAGEGNAKSGSNPKEVFGKMFQGAKNSWQYCISAWLVFALTLSIFPALTVNIGTTTLRTAMNYDVIFVNTVLVLQSCKNSILQIPSLRG